MTPLGMITEARFFSSLHQHSKELWPIVVVSIGTVTKASAVHPSKARLSIVVSTSRRVTEVSLRVSLNVCADCRDPVGWVHWCGPDANGEGTVTNCGEPVLESHRGAFVEDHVANSREPERVTEVSPLHHPEKAQSWWPNSRQPQW